MTTEVTPDLERQENTGALSTFSVNSGVESIPPLYARPKSAYEADKKGKIKVILLVALVPLSALGLVIGGTLVMTRDQVYREDIRAFPRSSPPETGPSEGPPKLPWWIR